MGEYENERQQIVDACRVLVDRGYLMATGGNVSVRVPHVAGLAITPSDYDYARMAAADVCVVAWNLAPLAGTRKPSVETAMHAAIYHARPDVNAVIHTHQAYAGALALIDAPIPALFDEQVRFLGRSVEIIPYAPSGTGMLKKKIATRVRNHHNAYILQNHGVLCFGGDLERAINNIEILEKCCLSYLLALCTERRVTRIPLAVREIAFAKLRQDQKKLERGDKERV